MTTALSRLRRGAEAVAVERLPRMVAQLDTGYDQVTLQRLMAEAAKPIPIDGRDEIGQVTAAFNSVAAAAARITGEQAALRATVSGILLSLSRRLQLRADRMMVSLDGLERYEQDPDRLEKLFDLDHVATLIRRLIANLQVLSGGRAGRPVDKPVSLPDLFRAAGAEIDDYRRITLGSVDEALLISRDAAVELMHLLAELLDNATKFSPPTATVTLEGRRVGDRLHIQIHDNGIGMNAATLHILQDRLANPGRMDQGTTQQMGLPVIGRIAERHGVKVDYRSELHVGTRVDVTVPANLLTVAPVTAGVPRLSVPGHRAATVELPVLAEERKPNSLFSPTVAVGPLPPPAQPIPPRAFPSRAPVAALPAPTPGPPSTAAIFEQLRSEARRTWFAPESPGVNGNGAPEPVPSPVVPTEWQTASAAAEAARTEQPKRTTANGLPVREPGRRLIPALAKAPRPQAPVLRDPETLRRQMSAFETGLGAAGRRSHPVPVEESAR
jgi:signal transduction histidine kinase